MRYLEFPGEQVDLKTYREWIENLNDWKHIEILFFYFYILDIDYEGFISQYDMFQWITNTSIKMLEDDFIQIVRYFKSNKFIDFEENKPYFLYDFLAFISLKNFSHEYYPYDTNIFLNIYKDRE